MNNYIIDLVKCDLKKYKDFGIVRNSEDEDSFLIYSSEKIDPYLIIFKNYCFDIAKHENGKTITHLSFSHLSSAIEFIESENK